MGSACCVAAREHHNSNNNNTPLPSRINSVRRRSSSRNASRSRGRVAEELQNVPCLNSGGNSLDFSMDAECGSVSEQKSPGVAMEKSVNCADASLNSISSTPEPSVDSGFLNEAEELTEQSAVANPLASRLSFSTPLSSSSYSMSYGDSSAHGRLLSIDSTPSSQTHHSPGYRQQRHDSVNQIRHSDFRSPNNSKSQKRASFKFSPVSKDSTVGSQGGASSDSWSMSTFSEMVASSQREQWSFDTDSLDFSRGNVIRSTNNTYKSPSIDLRTCGVCLKLLTGKSPWVAQKFTFSNELSVVAVLLCGHVYHAECLEKTTPDTSKFDPPCPVCTNGDKHALNIFERAVKLDAEYKAKHRKSRHRIKDSNLGSEPSALDHRRSYRREGKSPVLGSSSSMKNSFTRPFLRRHFSLGSKSNKSILDDEISIKPSKKGFWGKYQKG